MRINRLFLCLIACFLFYNAKAQLKDTFEKGIIITNENVKLDGFIKANDLSHLSSEICFKINVNDKNCVSYNTSQIKSFQTETGKSFELFTIKINNNSTEVSVFANLIVKGETSLYKSIWKSSIFYIVVTKDKSYVLQDDELISGETAIRKYYFQRVLNIATEGFMTNRYPNISFDEKVFIKIIREYNDSKGQESTELTYNEENVHYFIVELGGGLKKSESEFFFQTKYRLYYPKISRSTSLNIGLNYFNYSFSASSNNRNDIDYKQSLLSIPLQFQQNLLNKNVRPYLFAGLSLCYLDVKDDNNNSLIDSGLQNKFGIGLLYGTGIEIDLTSNIILKSELRNELFDHLLLFGIGYNFSR